MASFTSYDSIGEKLKRQLSTKRKFSSDVLLKFKRRKVSAVRDFPEAFGQSATHINRAATNDALVSVGEVKNLLGKKGSAGGPEDDCVEHFEHDDGHQENVVPNESHALSYNFESERMEQMVASNHEEAPQLVLELPKALDDSELTDQLETLKHENTDLIESRKSKGQLKLNNVLEDGAHAQQVDTPSSLKMWPLTSHKIYGPQQKVSAVRKFPKAFEQFAGQVNWMPNGTLVFVGTVENLLGKKDNVGDLEADFEPIETDVGSHRGKPGLCYNLESEKLEVMVYPDEEETLHLDLELLKASDDAESNDQLITLEDESADFVDSISAGRLKLKNLLDYGTHGQQVDRSSSLKKWPDTPPKICFPQRRVSAIRCFPPGCGRNVTILGKGMCVKASPYKIQGLSCKKSTVEHEPFEEAVSSYVKQVTVQSQAQDAKSKGSFSVKGGDRVQPIANAGATKAMKKKKNQLADSTKLERIDSMGKCVKPTHSRNLYQSDIKSKIHGKKVDGDIGGSEWKLRKQLTNNTIDVNRDIQANMNQLQERATVLALMAAPRCPWRQSKRAFRPNLK